MRAPFRLALIAALGAGPAVAQPLPGFQTADRAISCMASAAIGDNPAQVRCDVSRMRNRPPRPQEPCGGVYGSAFSVAGAGPGERLCVGDTTQNDALPVLAYGASFEAHGVRCSSARSGVTCRNAGGHGFSISRTAQRVF
jgi:hypothetical protein